MPRPLRLSERGLPASALSLAAGALAALAFPPFGFLPGLLGYGLLMRLADLEGAARPLRSAFWRGWLAGLAFFLISTWWVAEAFLVDAREQGWMAPIAVALLAAGLGLFWGVATLLYRALRPGGALRVLVFAGAFCGLEWLRGHILTGFPWDLAGETWAAGSAPSQMAAVVGAYGLGWITVAAGAAPAMLVGGRRSRRAWAAAGLSVASIGGLYLYGNHRLAGAEATPKDAPLVRVVQPRVAQESKYDERMFRSILERYVALTARPAARTPDIVVWPEGAVPDSVNDYLADGTWTKAAIEGALRPGQTLIDGAYRVAGTPDRPIYYNTVLALREGRDGLAVTGVYDKFRLVPFGEYMPMDSLMGRIGFKSLVHVGDGFTAGPRPHPLRPAGAPPVQPLICYESLFPGFTREGAAEGGRARWIVNVSNDAWFGHTYGPVQHLNLASYRAIEEGLPLVRATPTGVSAVIDAYGRIVPGSRLGQDEMGVTDTLLPAALTSTPYFRHGGSLYWMMLTVSVAAAAASYRRNLGQRSGI
ncbi:apolipoprotein N-acyltransferase [Phenylobacterium montanum]|uniref:Apolipoprotein N-acyltransferase n=1 Tax=Phenylobacterium montanum TaxID=2823693 RepID=A0A975ITG1_9CAUL|nr:apolipoprotein N-acyltransferase [Caulobacter sp. S6]QUD86429.1 apolipoprotein N-acyltransferase [Caulobacter sp. S6]